ncbi:hypothetical protein JDV09_03215 [Mycobacterium sp. Y57]|uniref:hypothetical protein n=1 Tax=Mycolicibacterium xanthum TaxID=2796469 RepID=UPI001C8642C6|nr:hypothetical protein [Mycolicibacterium xanthum]MBX7431124.1 hypothetical protein [Mycolicibacterium xanthum]
MTEPDPAWIAAAVEQHIAMMSDAEFDELITRTRPPSIGKGSAIPNLGQQPQRPSEHGQLAAAEREGDWATAQSIKAAQLQKLIREQSRGW